MIGLVACGTATDDNPYSCGVCLREYEHSAKGIGLALVCCRPEPNSLVDGDINMRSWNKKWTLGVLGRVLRRIEEYRDSTDSEDIRKGLSLAKQALVDEFNLEEESL